MGCRCKQNRVGFTLLEIIISITLLVLIALMMSRVFNESTKAVNRGSDQLVLDDTARMLLDAFEQDISQALIRTNVAFRIYPDSRDGTLYFVSTAVRKQNADIPRDTAPLRISSLNSETDSLWNRYINLETAGDTAGNTSSAIRNLINHSDYYITNRISSAADVGKTSDAIQSINYTRAASNQLKNHAVLTFLDFRINGDPDWIPNALEGLAAGKNSPRFIDVSIGLIPARSMKIAIRRNTSSYIRKNENIYTRRIYMMNQGIQNLLN